MELPEYLASLQIEPFVTYSENSTRALMLNWILQSSLDPVLIGNAIKTCINVPERLQVSFEYEPLLKSCMQKYVSRSKFPLEIEKRWTIIAFILVILAAIIVYAANLLIKHE